MIRTDEQVYGFGSVIVTPGQEMDSADAVNGDIQRLDTDVQASGVSDSFKQEWGTFVTQWSAFYGGITGVTGYLQRLWGGTQDQIDDYRKRLSDWQSRFEAQGGAVTGPGVDKPPTPGPTLGDTLSNIMWAAAIAGGLYLYFTYGRKKG